MFRSSSYTLLMLTVILREIYNLNMGLQEKRAIESMKTTQGPIWEKRIAEAVPGITLKLEVVWETLAVNGELPNFGKWEWIFLESLTRAFKVICLDKKNEVSLRAHFDTIVFQNVKGAFWPENSMSFVGKKIIIDHTLFNAEKIDDRSEVWASLIEEKLL